MSCKRAPVVVGKAETEMSYCAVGKHSPVKVVEPFFAERLIKGFVVKPRRLAVCFIYALAQLRHTVVIGIFGKLHSGALREELYRVDIIEVFDFHYEGDHVASHSAAEAIEGTVFGIDVERRRFFAVERTKSDHISAAALQVHIWRNDLGNVVPHF